jgi:ABC-2 type transport system permease protein
MKLRRLWAMARKEFIHILRDYRSLGLSLALPVFLLFLFGYALTLDVDRVPLAFWDQSNSPESRELLARFDGSRYFSLGNPSGSYAELEEEIDHRRALAALVIPADFGRRLSSDRPAEVQWIVDGSDSATASIANSYAEAVTLSYSREVMIASLTKTRGPAAADLLEPPLELRPRVWFNPELESRHYIVPGLIAVIIMVIAALLTSLTVAREWEQGTMEQLISTPVRGSEILAGKLVPYYVIGMIDVFIAVVLATLFAVPLRGSPLLLFGVSALFVFAGLSMGVLISTAARNQVLANQMAIVTTFLPSFLLSGFIYAIRNMPAPVEMISRAVPSRYYVTMIRAIFLKGVGFDVIYGEALFLAAFSAVMAGAALLKFKKRLG